MKIITPGDPGFYINRRRWHERESHMAVGVEGIYTLRAIKPGVGVVRETSFHNLITNLGMDAIGNGGLWSSMHLGTGTTPPAVTDTGLANFGVAITNTPTSDSGASPTPPYYGYRRMTWTSSVGGATGVWTEIGISSGSANGNLRSRELIRDNLGNPTSFPVQSDEQFEGTYELRMYVPESDVVADISLSGVTYTTTTRPLRATGGIWAPNLTFVPGSGHFGFVTGPMQTNTCAAMNGDLAAVTDTTPSGTVVGGGNTTGITSAYVPGSYQRDYGIRFGAGVAVGSINVLRLICTTTAWQVKYHTPVNKLTTEEFIHNQRFSWVRR